MKTWYENNRKITKKEYFSQIFRMIELAKSTEQQFSTLENCRFGWMEREKVVKDMKYIVVRTYGNGKHMNKVFSLFFEYLSQAERICDELNKHDKEDSEKWIPMPVSKYEGEVWHYE